ncbi:MAG: type III pantothenate kinase [Bacillota bacterium]|nr:type III pantothenate kinase [Bacillota bacterium]
MNYLILVLDIGNTNITIGVYDGNELFFESRLATDRNKTKYEYAVDLSCMFSVYNIDTSKIDGAMLCSVVPPLTTALSDAIFQIIGEPPMIVGPGIKTGLNIKIDDPSTLGADFVADAVGAVNLYETPCIIIDLGTATKISVIDENNNFLGGVIIPGIGISMNALTQNTALLQSISFEKPKRVIGTNTSDSMKSGTVFGTASMIDGMCDRIESELQKKCSVIATGGFSPLIAENCRREVELCDILVLEGLRILYEKNKEKKIKLANSNNTPPNVYL